MKVELEWQKELPLKYHEKDDAYQLDLESISEGPGFIFLAGDMVSCSRRCMLVKQVPCVVVSRYSLITTNC
jgi:hypothetical protein